MLDTTALRAPGRRLTSFFDDRTRSSRPPSAYPRAARRAREWSVSSASWSNQPVVGARYGSVSHAKGYSSACPAGFVGFPITALAQKWVDESVPNYGVRVQPLFALLRFRPWALCASTSRSTSVCGYRCAVAGASPL
ncbi:MAG: DNRLRE domain-containing protein [Actinobacteria bacterium]|nr:DNRLRE domain-containing protein [Actinomycetota bacterium]